MNKDNTDGAKTGKTRSTRSNERLRQSSPSSSDVQQLFVIKEEVSPEWCPSQEQMDPEPLHIKEEQEEHWTSQEGGQLNGLKETDMSRYPSTAVPVKTEDDEEKPQRSDLHQSRTEDNREAELPASSSTTQIKTETDEMDSVGSEPARNREPESHPQLNADEEGSDCSETDVSSGPGPSGTKHRGVLTRFCIMNTSTVVTKTVFPADVQQLLVIKEEVSPEWSPRLDQKDPEPLHIKEEQEELWTSQEGEQLHGLEEADITRPSFTAFTVKSEDDEEKLQTSQFHQIQTEDSREAEPPASSSATQIKAETDGEDSGGSEPVRNQEPDRHTQLNTDEEGSDFSETEVSSDDWQEPLSDSGPETEESDDNDDDECCGLKKKVNTQTRDNSGGKSFGCDICGKRFTQQRNLKPHMRIHTGEKPFGCGECGKRFNQQSHLERHMRVHRGEKPFGCDVCGATFRLKKTLEKHMRVHTGEKPFGCGDCGRRFREQKRLKTHMRVHTGEKPFGCDICGKRFTLQGPLKTHMKIHTEEKPFSCDVCGAKFHRKTYLDTHMRVHTGEKPFGCDVCGIRFSVQSNLKRHMGVHTGEKPFSCGDCGKRFRGQRRLTLHMRVHTGEKPFSCDVCEKKFTEQGSLKTHMRLHSGEKPFGCDVCGTRFNFKSSFETHMRFHRGERPFGCSECGKRFTGKGNLKKHMIVHSRDKPFGCDVCGERFKEQRNLMTHERVHSG
ncbi:uncharacterized protein AB9X84_026547 isoform 1-T1 [Acanthopagrus schlegelii]